MKLLQIVVVAAVLILLSCNNGDKVNTTQQPEAAADCCKKDSAQNNTSAGFTDASIFNLQSNWKNQEGHVFHFSELAGSVTVVAMVFTSCQSACPQIMGDIKKIESGIDMGTHKNIRFLLITMDPENDTPERLNEFRKEHQLSNAWTLVCSGDDATMEVANVLGVRIKKLSGGGFDHSNAIFVLNTKGEIVHKQEGLGKEPDETIKAISELK